MKESIPSLLELRILVLILGEVHHDGWWKSQFLSPIGLSFLERIYPRSTFAAAVRSASRAALSVHDANVGKGAVSHLFRLPRQAEREIEIMLAERSEELATRYKALIADRAALLKTLETLAGDSATQSLVGPVRISTKPHELIPKMAAAYLSAFHEGVQVFPYFDVEKASL